MLSTKDMATGGGKTRPIIGAGNNIVRINSISMSPTPWDPSAFNIHLHVETEPRGEGFEGFMIDKENPSLGKYAGQIGRVRMSPFAYQDATLPSGTEIKKDTEILKGMIYLSEVLGMRSELDSIEATTIEAFVESCNKLFSDSDFFHVCLASRQWENKEGYTQDDLYLPKFSKAGIPMEALDTEPSRLVQFDKNIHVKVPKGAATTKSFEPTVASNGTASSSDFEL